MYCLRGLGLNHEDAKRRRGSGGVEDFVGALLVEGFYYFFGEGGGLLVGEGEVSAEDGGVAVSGGDGGLEADRVGMWVDGGEGGDGGVAVAVEEADDFAFEVGAHVGGLVVEGVEEFADEFVVFAALEGEGALAGGG